MQTSTLKKKMGKYDFLLVDISLELALSNCEYSWICAYWLVFFSCEMFKYHEEAL